jgi:xylan 1,4-beta-xylosidase
VNRRDIFRAAFGTAATSTLVGLGVRSASAAINEGSQTTNWRRGIEGQRLADQGNGFFLNPIMSGDRPDPAILKDGNDYYMTFSSFHSYPGLIIWHSRDLVNWQPRKPSITKNIGSVWAPSLDKVDGRYFIYIPTVGPNEIYVIWADSIDGPWSDPINLNLPGYIDPCHAVGEDGSRWLFLNKGDRIRLAADGLSTVGKPEHVYDPWHYPDDWTIEGFSPEGPKIYRRGEYYYYISAVGGTAGPPTSHMVIAARSRSIHGPWEQCPHNPLVRTLDSSEKWWSRGHASFIDAPDGKTWAIYHGFENGFWTLGRQTLLDPIEWGSDNWPRMTGGDLSRPILKPMGGQPGPHGLALSDDFKTLKLGSNWNFFKPLPSERGRVSVENETLVLKAAGTTPSDSRPLLLIPGDQAYEFECDIEITPGVNAGVLLFYDEKLYCGLAFDEKQMLAPQYGEMRPRPEKSPGRRVRIRATNDRHIVTYHTSTDGGMTWKRFERSMEVSGYHHNVRWGFLSLKPGIYAAGKGEARFRNFQFRAL